MQASDGAIDAPMEDCAAAASASSGEGLHPQLLSGLGRKKGRGEGEQQERIKI